MLGRPVMMEPVFIKVCAGSWLICSVHMERTMQMSSATLPMTSHLSAEVLIASGKTFPAAPSAILLRSGELLLVYQTGNAENRRNHCSSSAG